MKAKQLKSCIIKKRKAVNVHVTNTTTDQRATTSTGEKTNARSIQERKRKAIETIHAQVKKSKTDIR